MTGRRIDLGDDHSAHFVQWSPDRALNPQYADRPDIIPCGVIIDHLKPDGETCSGVLYFDLPGMAELFPGRPRWTVESLDPLTLSPSVLCRCGDHGFVRAGRWERA